MSAPSVPRTPVQIPYALRHCFLTYYNPTQKQWSPITASSIHCRRFFTRKTRCCLRLLGPASRRPEFLVTTKICNQGNQLHSCTLEHNVILPTWPHQHDAYCLSHPYTSTFSSLVPSANRSILSFMNHIPRLC